MLKRLLLALCARYPNVESEQYEAGIRAEAVASGDAERLTAVGDEFEALVTAGEMWLSDAAGTRLSHRA